MHLVTMFIASSLMNKAAIVTGGTRGSGRGISEALAANGFSWLLNRNYWF